MAKTVVIVSEKGRLTDAVGAVREDDVRYSRLANRMLGPGEVALLNYGWNDADELEVSKFGKAGKRVTVKADEVALSGALTVGGVGLDEAIGKRTDIEATGVSGVSGEVTVTLTDGEGGSKPRKLCVIGIDGKTLSRITTVEEMLDGLIRLDEVFVIGDGIEAVRGDKSRLSVRAGTGLKFEDRGGETKSLAVDSDDEPVEKSGKTVTSAGLFLKFKELTAAISGMEDTLLDLTEKVKKLREDVDSLLPSSGSPPAGGGEG